MTITVKSASPDRGVDAGLLFLRLVAGLSLFLLFGLQKLQAGWAFHHTGEWQFVDFNRKMGLLFSRPDCLGANPQRISRRSLACLRILHQVCRRSFDHWLRRCHRLQPESR